MIAFERAMMAVGNQLGVECELFTGGITFGPLCVSREADAVLATPIRLFDMVARMGVDLRTFTIVAIDEYDDFEGRDSAEVVAQILASVKSDARFWICQSTGTGSQCAQLEKILRSRKGVVARLPPPPTLDDKNHFFVNCDQEEFKVMVLFINFVVLTTKQISLTLLLT